jgi:beta-phosphoglucomutase-like phosphatase (HAD superfamily)
MNLTQPQALIFDCDGTLADTMPLHWRPGRNGDETLRPGFFGGAILRVGRRAFARHSQNAQRRAEPPLDPLAASKEKEAAYIPFLPEVRAIEPVVKIVRENAGKLPMAVASGGNQEHINEVLTHWASANFSRRW